MSPELRSRYPGAQPFSDDDLSRRLFFGRSRETELLVNQVLAHRLVVVYARSGLGKSSLLNAGVAQRLRDEGFLPLTLRVNAQGPEIVRSLLDDLEEAVRHGSIEYQPGGKTSLWHYFKTAEFWRADVLQTPVLILDQFEELFTLQTPAARSELLAELGALIRGVRPAKAGESAEERELTERAPAIRVVLSLREEFLGSLEEAADWIPQILEQRFRLLPLGSEAAAEALLEPARLADDELSTPPFDYSPEARELILDFLANRSDPQGRSAMGEVEPFQLQLICQHVERRLLARRRGGDAQRPITAKDVGGRKGLQAMLTSFYCQQLPPRRRPLQRRRVRRLCEESLINPEGRRISLEASEARRLLHLKQATLDRLVTLRLLRADRRADSTYYELSHDTLVDSILASRRGLGIARGVGSLGLAIVAGFFSLVLAFSLLAQISLMISPDAMTGGLEPQKAVSEPAPVVATEGFALKLLSSTLALTAALMMVLLHRSVYHWRRGSQTLQRYGQRRRPAVRKASRVRRRMAGILALVFGWLGLHKLYLRYYAQVAILLIGSLIVGPFLGAALYMFWGKPASEMSFYPFVAWGPALALVLGVVEGTIYLTMPEERFVERYVQGRRPWF